MRMLPRTWHRLTRPSLLAFLLPVLLSPWSWSVFMLTSMAILLCVAILMRNSTNSLDVDVVLRSSMLGAVATLSVLLYLQESTRDLSKLYMYMLVLSLFHFSEFLATCVSNPSNLSVDSFLLNHSTAYHVALVASFVEFFVESYFLSSFKGPSFTLGLTVCLCGEMLRKTAMLTAGTNFSHLVTFEKQPDHRLVTHGVFRLMRHPSYLGWLLWSLGTQLILSNPVCFVVYAVVSWRFFNERIYIEEFTLIDFFGEEYKLYQEQVSFTGIPFVTGYRAKQA